MFHPTQGKEDNPANCREPEAGPLPQSLQKKGLMMSAANDEFAATVDRLLVSFRARILEEHARCLDADNGEWARAFGSLETDRPAAKPQAGDFTPRGPEPKAAPLGPQAAKLDLAPPNGRTADREEDLACVKTALHALDKDRSGCIDQRELKRCFRPRPGVDEGEALRASRNLDMKLGPKLNLEEACEMVERLQSIGMHFVPPSGEHEDMMTQMGCKRHTEARSPRRSKLSKAERRTLSSHVDLARKITSQRVKVSRLFLQQRMELELDLVNAVKQLLLFALFLVPFWVFILLVRQPVEIADAHRMLNAHYGIQPTQLAGITEWSQVYTFMEAFTESNDLLQATGKVYWCDPRFLDKLGVNDAGKKEYQRQGELLAQISGHSHRRLAGRSLDSDAAGMETLEQKLLRLKLAYQNPTPLGEDAEGHPVNLYDCALPSNYEMLTWYHRLQDAMRDNATAPVTDYGSRRRDSRRLAGSFATNGSNATNFTYKASELGPKAEYQAYFPEFRTDYINYNVQTHEQEYQHHPNTDKFLPRYRYPYRQVSLLNPLVYQQRITPVACTNGTFDYTYSHQSWNLAGPLGLNGPRATDVLDCFDKDVLAEDEVADDIDTDGYIYKDQMVYARFAHQAGTHTGGNFQDWQRVGWLDKLTKDVTISALLYTQDIELFTMITVQFEQGAGGGVHATVKLDSVIDFDMGRVGAALAMGIMSALVAVVVLAHSIKRLVRKRRELGRSSNFMMERGVPALLFEIFGRSTVILFLVVYMTVWASLPENAVEFDKVLHTFLDLPDFSHSSMHTAIQEVLRLKETIDGNAAFERQMGFVCAIVFSIQAFQLVMYVSVHPRLAVLMTAMVKTVDDIVHFMILFGTLFLLFGFFAHFTFASSCPGEFGALWRALLKQFELIIGYGDDWPWRSFDNMDPLAATMFQLYVITFVLLVFFIMINFFVGIVLQGFFDTKKEVEDLVIERSFMADMTDVPLTFYHFIKEKWPNRADTLKSLRLIKDSGDYDTLGPGDLVRLCKFPDVESASAFLHYYCLKIPVLLEEGL